MMDSGLVLEERGQIVSEDELLLTAGDALAAKG
jgi:hypothetical protein